MKKNERKFLEGASQTEKKRNGEDDFSLKNRVGSGQVEQGVEQYAPLHKRENGSKWPIYKEINQFCGVIGHFKS